MNISWAQEGGDKISEQSDLDSKIISYTLENLFFIRSFYECTFPEGPIQTRWVIFGFLFAISIIFVGSDGA